MQNKLTGFYVKVEDHPGVIASIADVVGKQGINIDGCTGISLDGKGVIYFITNNTQETTVVLNKAGIKFETREFLEISIQDKPGELAKLTKSLADVKININALFISLRKTIVIAVDKTDQAAKILQKFKA
jgi:hypothetical protein